MRPRPWRRYRPQQALVVLRERRVIPGRIVKTDVEELGKQQAVLANPRTSRST